MQWYKVIDTCVKKKSLIHDIKLQKCYRPLISSVVIGVGFNKKDHNSISRNYNWEKIETLCQNWPPNQIRQSNGSDTGGENKNVIQTPLSNKYNKYRVFNIIFCISRIPCYDRRECFKLLSQDLMFIRHIL
jgi:hypothetical protein